MGCESLVSLTHLYSGESRHGPLLAGGQMDLLPAVGEGDGEPWAPTRVDTLPPAEGGRSCTGAATSGEPGVQTGEGFSFPGKSSALILPYSCGWPMDQLPRAVTMHSRAEGFQFYY